jgi:hypothetical protein
MEYKELIKEDNGLSVSLIQDEDAQNPREDYDNFGTMVCFHRRYTLGDKHEFSTPDEFLEWWKENGKGGELLCLGLLDHSGLHMYSGSGAHWTDSAGWDSGQVGWIYVTAQQIRDCFMVKHISKKTRQRAIKNLEGEIETYDQFLTGDVWGYVIEGTDEEEHDSCWGFFGSTYAKTEALEAFKYFVDKRKAEETRVESFIESCI